MKRTGIVLLATAALVPAVTALAARSPKPSRPEIAGPSETTPGRHAYFFSSIERGVRSSRIRFRCGLDTTRLKSCARETTLVLVEGSHVLRAQAVDPSGRRSALATLPITVQAVAPAIAVTQAWQKSVKTQSIQEALYGAATGADGTLYVSDAADDQIQVYDPAGNLLRTWGSRGTGPGQFQFEKNPDPGDANIPFSAVAVDQRTGQVFVSEPQRVQRFDAQGDFQTGWGNVGTDNGQFTRITDLTISPTGTVDVLEDRPSTQGRVQEFDPDGTFLTTFGRGQIVDPGGIALDPQGNVLVADDKADTVRVFGADGHLLRSFGKPGGAPGQLNFPSEMAVAGNTLYICDTFNERIVRFDLSTEKPNGYWDVSDQPVTIAADASGGVYVITQAGLLTKYQVP